MPIEAYPDVGDVTVEVITLWPGHAAEEVERLITIQLEKELNGIANVTFLRSASLFGLSNIRVLFADGTDKYWARQQVQERIAGAEVPTDARPTLGALSSVIGEVYRYTLWSPTMPLVELKALQDWVLEREFLKVAGVADVISWGGGVKQYQITIDPARLRAYNLTLKQVFDAVAANNANAGGSYIPWGQYALTVRGIGMIQSTRDIENIVVAAPRGTPVRVRDLGTVGIGHGIRLGVLGRDHDDDVVGGIVRMRKGENPGAVIDGVRTKLEEITQLLPAGVELRPYYNRERLVKATVGTVMKNLIEGAALVVLLLSLFLYNIRAAILVALTISLAVIGSLVLTLTLIPVLASLLFRRPPSERESPLVRWLRRPYTPALAFCLRRPVVPIGAAAVLLVLSLVTFTFLGKEFLPELDEGDMWVRVALPLGISVEGGRPYVREMREQFLRFPEVHAVVSQLGAPDDGTDPEAPDNAEFYVGLKPREAWTTTKDREELIEKMRAALLGAVPGITTNFSQPIRDNGDEAMAGVKGELAIKLYGPDLFVMDAKAREIVSVMRPIHGVTDLDYDHFVGLPQLQIIIDRAATARYGINIQDVQDGIEAATKGRVVTQVFEGERRFDLAVRLPGGDDPLATLKALTVSAPSGERIPVTQLAEFIQTDGLAEIDREANARRLAIKWSVRERDMGSLVAEAMQKMQAVTLPEGYRMVWSGRFEDQQRALARLYVIVPLVIFIIFILLFGAFQSVRDALLIMLNLPFALIGGTLALFAWGTHFNISYAVFCLKKKNITDDNTIESPKQ